MGWYGRVQCPVPLWSLWTTDLLPWIVQATDVQGRFKSTCPAGEDFDLLTWAHVLTCTSTSGWCGGNHNLHGVHDTPQPKRFLMVLASWVAAALTPVNFWWAPLHCAFFSDVWHILPIYLNLPPQSQEGLNTWVCHRPLSLGFGIKSAHGCSLLDYISWGRKWPARNKGKKNIRGGFRNDVNDSRINHE